MTPENETRLRSAFPSLYESLSYFGCGDGWTSLLMKATLELKEISSSLKAVQVKEKFGALRFYTSVAANDVEAKIIAEAEKASACTCEECGQPGKARGGGWIRTLCDQCESGQQVK